MALCDGQPLFIGLARNARGRPSFRCRGRSYPIAPNSYYPISPPINWGGVYIGLNGGYGLGSSSWTNSFGSTGNFAVDGGVFSGTLGINYTGFGDWVLLGLEGDFDRSGATAVAAVALLVGAGAAGRQPNLPNQD